MNKNSRVVSFLVALSVVLGCVVVSWAQTQRPIVGGYKPISTDDSGVLEAAEHALAERGEKEGVSLKLVSVDHAESQVVAGTNYRLCLNVAIDDEDDESGETQEVKVVVFRSLQAKYSLKSWNVEECSESH